jgi:hypothetical protein
MFGNHLIRVKQFNDKKYNLSSAYFFCINLFEIYDYTIVQFKMQEPLKNLKTSGGHQLYQEMTIHTQKCTKKICFDRPFFL